MLSCIAIGRYCQMRVALCEVEDYYGVKSCDFGDFAGVEVMGSYHLLSTLLLTVLSHPIDRGRSRE